MEKVVNGSEEYLQKESKRYVFFIRSSSSAVGLLIVELDRRLASILGKRTLAVQKLDEIKIKANILAAFKRAEEKLAEAEEAIKRATAEL